MTTRPLRPEDIMQVAELHLLAWKRAFRGILSDELLQRLTLRDFEQRWADTLKNEARENLVILIDGVPAGFVSFSSHGGARENRGRGEIIGIYLHPRHSGKRLGEGMVAAGERELRKSGYFRAFLWTMEGNGEARRFYERCGYRLTGRERISERYSETFLEVEYERRLLVQPSVERYSEVPLPSSRYLSGEGVHPSRRPGGSHVPEVPPAAHPFTADAWRSSPAFLYGVDLFNNGYWWEAHEVWEALWKEAGEGNPAGGFVQGLIQVSAALLKEFQGMHEGALRLAGRGLNKVAAQPGIYLGIDTSRLSADVNDFLQGGRDGPPVIRLAGH